MIISKGQKLQVSDFGRFCPPYATIYTPACIYIMTSTKQHTGPHRYLALIVKVLKYALPVVVSSLLVVWLFHRVDYHEVMGIIREGCDFRYIAGMMFLTMLSYVIRGIRWGIQLRAVGIPRLPVAAESSSIFGAYALNLLFPYLGEAWRCVDISKRTRTPLTTVVGTDIGYRISDAIVISIFIIASLIVAHPVMMKFLNHYRVVTDISTTLRDPYVWGGLFVLAGVVFAIFHWCGRLSIIKKMEGGIAKIWQGFIVLFHLKGAWWYLILTIGIWACYFYETYLCLYAFPFTRELISGAGMADGYLPGLVVFVFGSCSVAVPSNGGLGPWNIAVMFALSLYSISEAEGTAYSLTVWTFQTLMIIACGIFAAIYLALTPAPKKGNSIEMEK